MTYAICMLLILPIAAFSISSSLLFQKLSNDFDFTKHKVLFQESHGLRVCKEGRFASKLFLEISVPILFSVLSLDIFVCGALVMTAPSRTLIVVRQELSLYF